MEVAPSSSAVRLTILPAAFCAAVTRRAARPVGSEKRGEDASLPGASGGLLLSSENRHCHLPTSLQVVSGGRVEVAGLPEAFRTAASASMSVQYSELPGGF